MKIQLTTEEVKKAIAYYTREKILYSTEYREIEQIEVDADGASLVVTEIDQINRAPAPAPCAPVAPSICY